MDQLVIKGSKFALAYLPRSIMASLVGQPSLEDLGNKELKYIKSQGLPIPPNYNKLLPVEGLEDGRARWFTEVEDRKPEDPVMIYFHGGAYLFGMSPSQTSILTTLHHFVPESSRLSIVWLDFTLSTTAPFPQQLIEAANTYSAVQASSNNIMLIGDSAGGNLAINLMRHVHSPFEGVPPVLHPKNKPTAAVLISPWVQLHVDEPLDKDSSYVKYSSPDYINVPGLNEGGDILLNEEKWPGCRKLFTDTYKDKSVPWEEVLPENGRIFVSVGEYEMIRDSVEEFCETSGLVKRGGWLFIEPEGVHDTPAILSAWKSKVTPEIIDFMKGSVKQPLN